jgi:deoxyribodipyrimidine photo-lyase
MTVILWFKRDLRVSDNAALATACAQAEPVLPLYIVEPELWTQHDASARQWDFIAESLAELRDALGALGAPLVVRVGGAVEILERARQHLGVTSLVSHEETGTLWTFARDRRVAAWARSWGIPWQEVPQAGVIRGLKDRDGWQRQRDIRLRRDPILEPEAICAVPGVDPAAIPSARDLGLAPCGITERQPGGRGAALSTLGSFLTERGKSYRKAMSSPLEGAWACSRLSPHLAFGTLSVREANQAANARRAELKGTRTGWTGSLNSFTSRLAWRDHFMQKLEDAPQIETSCLHSAYETLRPREPDPVRLQAWQRGETGLPFVDACMRSLIQTGWLNFRMRSMLMAVASYHLWLDWRATGPHLARMFTDYEPGIHWPQVQMQSGTTGMNTVRIYNPVKQGHDQDPTGDFTRYWCPELADVPDVFLQEPWRWDGARVMLGRTYPEPIMDVKMAAKAARDAVWGVRTGQAFRAEAQKIVKKHASRQSSRRATRFVRDGETMSHAAPSKGPNSRQLKLDL